MNQIVFGDKFHRTNFEITYEELHDILSYITDEFPDLTYEVDNSLQSSLIFQDTHSFTIFLQEKDHYKVLYYLEPKIFRLIEMISSQLREWDLYISAADFGENDTIYELVVSKVEHTPEYRPRYKKTLENSSANASSSGMGAVASPSVSVTSVSSSTSGSGDRTFTLQSKPNQKMGGPSEVSDLRYLKKPNIRRVKDFKDYSQNI